MNSPTATNAAKAKAKATYLQSKAGLAVALAMKKACSITDRIKIVGNTKELTFRDKVKNETGIDVYALGNAALAFGGAITSVAAMGLGILAAPETGGASLALTAFAFGSLAFACSDFIEYASDIRVGQNGDYRYATEKHSYNAIYDGLFNKNDSAYNNVRMFVDMGTIIFSLGTAYTVAAANKAPANVIKNVAGQNKYVPVKSGTLTGKLDGLTADERKVVKDLLDNGNDIEIIPRSNTTKMPDYYVNGVKTELKTLNGNSLNTPVTRIQDGFKQGAEVVIIDARKTNISTKQASQIIDRAVGVYEGKLPGKIEIWTNNGKVIR